MPQLSSATSVNETVVSMFLYYNLFILFRNILSIQTQTKENHKSVNKFSRSRCLRRCLLESKHVYNQSTCYGDRCYEGNNDGFKRLDGISLKEDLTKPNDIAACNFYQRLYVSDSATYGIWMIQPADSKKIVRHIKIYNSQGISVKDVGQISVVTGMPYTCRVIVTTIFHWCVFYCQVKKSKIHTKPFQHQKDIL